MAVDEPATTIFIVILEVFEIVFIMTGGRFETGVIANRQRDVPVPDLGLERPAGGIGLPSAPDPDRHPHRPAQRVGWAVVVRTGIYSPQVLSSRWWSPLTVFFALQRYFLRGLLAAPTSSW